MSHPFTEYVIKALEYEFNNLMNEMSQKEVIMFKTTKKVNLISFRADNKLANILEKLAEKNGVTVSTYIRMLLTSILIDEEEWDEYEQTN